MQRLTNIEIKKRMSQIVQKCIDSHNGGEDYFNELDGLIKNDEDFLMSYLTYISQSNVKNIIVSGEIGFKIAELREKYPWFLKDCNIEYVNGSLRKGNPIQYSNWKLDSYKNQPFIFIDDSYYSGKTFRIVKTYIEEVLGGELEASYVFYDGSEDNLDDVKSLYRYYDFHN
ncbi:MAG TPA: hypothetical protein DCW90_11290 [Lachnospiraceae bacterium]|nr:hypothetical protein [Lachnospiraceae bacterium]